MGLSDLGSYMQRLRDNSDQPAFLAVKTIRNILHNPELFRDAKLNTSRFRELVFEKDNFLSAYDKAYDSYCKEKFINLIVYLNEFRRYHRQIDSEETSFFYDFLARRLAYLLIDYKKWDNARNLLEQLKYSPACHDFVV